MRLKMEGLDIIDYTGEGYKPAMVFESWRVAFLNYADRFDKITKLERHMVTDEVFMLLEGEATLYIGLEKTPVVMERHKIYNVKKGVWHNIKVSPDAKVFIVENDNTTYDNSEYIELDEPLQ